MESKNDSLETEEQRDEAAETRQPYVAPALIKKRSLTRVILFSAQMIGGHLTFGGGEGQ